MEILPFPPITYKHKVLRDIATHRHLTLKERQEAIKNIMNNEKCMARLNEDPEILELSSLMQWSKTPQGYRYWERINGGLFIINDDHVYNQ